ncbi:MAG: hypothetical protein R3288_07495 [Woeseiaceae bacterium]|nr:hypothetical protein [Woeseiaceae bacterium]
MRTRGSNRIARAGAGLLLAALLATSAAIAQQDTGSSSERDAEIDALEPGVNTSGADAERDAIDPAVPTAVLAAEVTRSSSGGQVMDRMELGRTEITGNQELPKVLYIVPWKKADPGDLMGRPVNTLIDEVLAPVDREEFVRSVDFYDDLYRQGEE